MLKKKEFENIAKQKTKRSTNNIKFFKYISRRMSREVIRPLDDKESIGVLKEHKETEQKPNELFASVFKM